MRLPLFYIGMCVFFPVRLPLPKPQPLQTKHTKLRERDLRRAKAAEQDAKNRADAEKKDGKDERMEELLRKVWGGAT